MLKTNPNDGEGARDMAEYVQFTTEIEILGLKSRIEQSIYAYFNEYGAKTETDRWATANADRIAGLVIKHIGDLK